MRCCSRAMLLACSTVRPAFRRVSRRLEQLEVLWDSREWCRQHAHQCKPLRERPSCWLSCWQVSEFTLREAIWPSFSDLVTSNLDLRSTLSPNSPDMNQLLMTSLRLEAPDTRAGETSTHCDQASLLLYGGDLSDFLAHLLVSACVRLCRPLDQSDIL